MVNETHLLVHMQLKYLFTLRNAAAVQAPPDRRILPTLLTSASCDSVTCFV